MKGASVTGVAITVLGTLLIAAVAYGAASGELRRTAAVARAVPTPSASPEPSPTAVPVEIPSPRPKPAGMYAIDADMADGSTGWLLLTDCPVVTTCHYSVAGTTDSGRSWSHPVQVGPAFSSHDGGAPRTVRFASRSDGFVYGQVGAYVTHDGGKSWRNLGVPAEFVYSIAIGGSRVWLTTYPCPKGTQCQLEVRSSADYGRTWSVAHQLPADFSPESPVGFSTGVIMSSVPVGDIEIATNNGLTWRSIKSACGGNPFRGFATTADGIELWEICEGYPDSTGVINVTSLFVSEDGGKTWTRGNVPPVEAAAWPESLVSTRADVAFVAGQNRSVVTRDAGKTWSDISDEGATFTTIRFGTGWGWALDSERDVWQTVDGGDHWSQAGSLPDRLS